MWSQNLLAENVALYVPKDSCLHCKVPHFGVKISVIHDPFKIFLKIQRIPRVHSCTHSSCGGGRNGTKRDLRNLLKVGQTIWMNAHVVWGKGKQNYFKCIGVLHVLRNFLCLLLRRSVLCSMRKKFVTETMRDPSEQNVSKFACRWVLTVFALSLCSIIIFVGELPIVINEHS